MSKFFDACDAIASRLGELEVLSGMPIVVDRQKDIMSELRKVVGKQTGCLIVVGWIGASNEDKTADGPRFASKFAVTVIAKPVLRRGETAADDIIEAIASNLHNAKIAATDVYRDRLIVTGIIPVPHDDLLIHRIDLAANSQL